MDPIGYARQSIDNADLRSVNEVLIADQLTQGPMAARFERALSDYTGARFCRLTNSATSALHVACLACRLGPGDWLWTTANSYAASSNCGLYCGAKVDFVDVDPETGNISIDCLRDKLEKSARLGLLPKVLVAVHFAGLPCDMAEIKKLSTEYGFKVIEDASHAVGASFNDRGELSKIGGCEYSDITVFSFHAVKIITTGEGGCVLTNDESVFTLMSCLIDQGVERNSEPVVETYGEVREIWNYKQTQLGFNYRLTDVQAALGISQLLKVDRFVKRRNDIAERYIKEIQEIDVEIQVLPSGVISSRHFFYIRLDNRSRNKAYFELRAAGIFCSIHYPPIYLHPHYQALGFKRGLCPAAEEHFSQMLTLPTFVGLDDKDITRIVDHLKHSLV